MKKILKNNLFFKLLALFFAFIVWILIINLNDPVETDTIKDIKITTINSDILQSKDKQFSLANNGLVNIQISGRKTLISNLTADDFVAQADMSKVSITNTVEVTIKPKKDIDVLIYNNTRLINVSIDNVIEAPFPITIRTTGSPQDGMAVGGTTSNPEQVIIRGAESLLHKIKEVVGTVDITNARKDVKSSTELTIYDYEGNKINPESVVLKTSKVNAVVMINRIKTVPLVIKDVPKAATDYAVGDIIVNPMSVNITGSTEDLIKVNNIVIPYDTNKFGTINNETISGTFDITDYLPKDITLVGDNSMISFRIVIDKRFEKEITVTKSDISIRNRNISHDYSILNDVKIVIYGTKSALEKIQNVSDLNPYIDVKDYESGRYNFNLNINPIINVETNSYNIEVEIK